MNWNTDSSCSGLSSPRSLSPSPFGTPLTPVNSVGYDETAVSPSTPSRIGRIGRLQGLDIGSPIRTKERQAPVERTEDLLGDIRKRRAIFFNGHMDVLLPLLFGGRFIRGNLSSEELHPYMSLKSQPKGLRAILKPYQLEGLSFLIHLRNNGVNGILADEMGLGKTLQTLSLLQYVKENNPNQNTAPFLVVCPLSIIESWAAEVSKWTPTLSVLKYNGTQEERAKIKARVARQRRSKTIPDLVVASYDTVMSDITWFRRAFVWKYIVLDEGHRIRNSESKKSQLLDKIPAEFKLVLTGTPVQNDLCELWSVLHWLYPDVFDDSTAERFEEAYSLNEGKVDLQFLDSCKRFLDLVMLRRTKESSGIGLELPPKAEIALSVPLSRFQHASYFKRLIGVNPLLLDKLDSSVSVDFSPETDIPEKKDHGQPADGASQGIDVSPNFKESRLHW